VSTSRALWVQKLQDTCGWRKLSVSQPLSVVFACTGVQSKLSFHLNLCFTSEETGGRELGTSRQLVTRVLERNTVVIATIGVL